MATVLYARVSTTEQTIDHQRTQAESAGFAFDHVVVDAGVSGVSVKLADRPQGRRLFDMLRPGDTLVVRWVDRLGRNYEDVTANVRRFVEGGVTVRTVIHGMTFDGQPKNAMDKAVRDAMLAFMAASAEAQAQATKEAQAVGIALKRAEAPGKYRGRKPAFTQAQMQTVLDLLGKGVGPAQVAREAGVSRATVYRLKDAPEAAVSALKAWGLWQDPKAA